MYTQRFDAYKVALLRYGRAQARNGSDQAAAAYEVAQAAGHLAALSAEQRRHTEARHWRDEQAAWQRTMAHRGLGPDGRWLQMAG